MIDPQENVIFKKASICFDELRKSIQIFENILVEDNIQVSPDYYLAKNFLKKGKLLYQEALKRAKKLLGEPPDYVKNDFKRRRKSLLEDQRVLAKSQDIDDLRAELRNDELLNRWMSSTEIDAYLNRHYETQQTGKRKLQHIKVRIILDKMQELLLQAQSLQKKALDRLR